MKKTFSQYREEFSKNKIVKVDDFIDAETKKNLREEGEYLKKFSKKLGSLSSAHSKYNHVLPSNFISNSSPWRDGRWRLIDFYHSKQLKEIIENIVGKRLYCMPLVDDERFDINCKVNFYNFNCDNPSTLGWHYDRTDHVKGEIYIAVLTVKCDLEDYDRNIPILSYIQNFNKKSIFLGSGSMTIHDANRVFHKVEKIDLPENYPKEKPCERIVFVMKFCSDPTPLHPIEKAGKLMKWSSISAVSFMGASTIENNNAYIFILLSILMIFFIILFVSRK